MALLWDDAFAAPKNCRANYVLDNAGTITTGWIDLGTVGGTFVNKKKKCRTLASQNCAYAKAKLPEYAPVGSANFHAICKAGKVGVYFDTEVEGKKNTKDGTCSVPVACKCACTDYDDPAIPSTTVTLSGLHYPQIQDCAAAIADYKAKFQNDARLKDLCKAKNPLSKPVALVDISCVPGTPANGFNTGSVVSVVARCQ
jgi:hypothetical protein